MSSFDEERLARLLSALPPAPEKWVKAAQGLPIDRQRLEEIVRRATMDDAYRRRVVADPRRVLEEADVVAHSENIEVIRQRLDENEQAE